MSVCILHGPGAEKSVVQRTLKALKAHKVDGWEADRDGPLNTITSRLKEATLIVTLGGDGTFLAGGRLAAPRGIPLLGVNLGRLGFLTEIDADALEDGLARFFKGNYRTEERNVLQSTLTRDGKNIARAIGLNEAVINRAEDARLLRIEIDVEGQAVGVLDADGVMVATATGSTAYALASGGPILEPTLRDLVLVPINPFALTVRPIVFPPGQDISLSVLRGPADLRIDGGRRSRGIQAGDTLRCGSYPRRLKVVRFSPPEGFYRRLGEKLGWGRPLVPMK
ncbi:MAG TPA: NAD(+)/NADH kinase [Candidatus Dormibacteraeota bacterium]|jgi:NAD+ kinase|nr:NAD(+)/NADH kinase [Candidatus Dormibacteraeota bacterium]